MNLAYLSLGALVIAILVSCFTELNVGILSLAFAWIVGVYFGGMTLNQVIAGFPVALFLTLAGVTLLFSQAQLNGTLDRVAHRAVLICRGNTGLIPVMFFVLAATLASLGPGNVSTAALLAPMAMAVAGRAAIPAFLMIIMVGDGAQAGALSPFAPTGVIVNGIMDRIGLSGHEWHTYWTNLAAHALVAFGGYFLFGGLKLFSSPQVVTIEEPLDHDRGDRGAARRCVVFRCERRDGRAGWSGDSRGARRGRSQRGGQEDAVVRHRDDERRDGPHCAAGEDGRTRFVYGVARPVGDAHHDHGRYRVRDRV